MAAGTWYTSGANGMGTRLTETRLRESLEHISQRWHVKAPPQGRHRQAEALLRKWNESDDAVPLDDADTLRSLSEAHRLAWETFLIVVAGIEDRRNPRTPFTGDQFKTMFGGDLTSENGVSKSHNTQFEMYVAAILRLAGAAVSRGEPDLRLLYGSEDVGIAAKRIRSENPDQIQKNSREDARQILACGGRGWIALNFDTRFRRVDASKPPPELRTEFNGVFDSVMPPLRRAAAKSHVLGFMMFGYVVHWRPPTDGGAPRLQYSTVQRWQVLANDSAEDRFFDTFSRSWSERFAKRVGALASPSFTGLL